MCDINYVWNYSWKIGDSKCNHGSLGLIVHLILLSFLYCRFKSDVHVCNTKYVQWKLKTKNVYKKVIELKKYLDQMS